MKNYCLLIVLIFLLYTNNLQAQKSGEEIFKSVCASCHTIKKGRLVGPDLSGIYNKKNNDWLIKFIQSSQKFIKSGDTAAVNIFNQFNKIPMPDNPLTNDQVLSVINYIKETDQGGKAGTPNPVASNKTSDTSKLAADATKSAGDTASAAADTTRKGTEKPGSGAEATKLVVSTDPEIIKAGRGLFYGYNRFANGAAPCMSCHNINDETIMGGGKLAISLTGSYKKLGPEGIKAILSNPPFPAMRQALNNHELTEGEIHALISQFWSLNERKYPFKVQDSAGWYFLLFGFVGSILITVHIYLFYDNRKIT